MAGIFMSDKILVSACLAGCKCRYDGESEERGYIVELVKVGKVVLVCPEQLGGLETPRAPSERSEGKVVSIEGTDVTAEFIRGATKVLECAKKNQITRAIMKADSPSCGYGKIYDGNFDGTLIVGNGVAVEMLLENNIEVMDETEGELWYEQTEK